jgi:hypothetical protein
VEFYLSLAALYTVQCFIKIAKEETLGWRWRMPRVSDQRHTRLIRGGGWRLVHPWPAAFIFSGRSDFSQTGPPIDIPALRKLLGTAGRRTRALRWLSSLQLIWILLLGPIGALVLGAEASILILVGPALGIHLVSIVLLLRAQRVLLPNDSESGDRLMIAALYPPSMLRAGAELVRRVGADRQIAELASVVLSDREFEDLIRTEIGRAKRPRITHAEVDRDIAWLQAVAANRALDPDTLQSPRAQSDPTSESYCEFCGGDYVAGYRFCQECQLTTKKYS